MMLENRKQPRTEVDLLQWRLLITVFTQGLLVKYVLTKATSNTFEGGDILGQLLDCLHLFIHKLRLQPVGQLHAHIYSELNIYRYNSATINCSPFSADIIPVFTELLWTEFLLSITEQDQWLACRTRDPRVTGSTPGRRIISHLGQLSLPFLRGR